MKTAPSQAASEASQVERAYREIKRGIVEGRYRPGMPMSEVMLAREHNMSRTPVREGLARLRQEQYLERVAGHGYFVARVTVQSIHDTFDVRRVLEGSAAAWAAERATDEEIQELRRLASLPQSSDASRDPSDAPADYRSAEAANVRFHLAIAAAARNTLAMELIDRCLAKVDRFMSLGVSFGPFQQGATEAHLLIVDAIARRDPDAARRRMEEHLDCGSRLMKEALLRGQLTAVGVE
ncbi:MAG TPA: GntR family transcriptional regulator [Vicinamibacterales bacterium]|jgi:DNA-binding GntR family transcriptional regulator